MKRSLLWLTMALLLLPAAQATAKEVVGAKVCGASKCRKVEDKQSMMALLDGGAPTDPPSGPSPFYRATVTVKAEGERMHFPIVIVPRAGLIRGENEDGTFSWVPMSDMVAAQYRRMTSGLQPIPARKLRGLHVPKPEARVDEVVMIHPPSHEASAGAAPVWPWIAGGLAALALLALAWNRWGGELPGAGAVRSRP